MQWHLQTLTTHWKTKSVMVYSRNPSRQSWVQEGIIFIQKEKFVTPMKKNQWVSLHVWVGKIIRDSMISNLIKLQQPQYSEVKSIGRVKFLNSLHHRRLALPKLTPIYLKNSASSRSHQSRNTALNNTEHPWKPLKLAKDLIGKWDKR